MEAVKRLCMHLIQSDHFNCGRVYLGKRRTYPALLSRDEYERDQERTRRMVEGITGVRIEETRTPLTTHTHPAKVVEKAQRRRPKANFRIPLNETDSLQFTVWSGKKDPEAEVLVASIQRKQGESWQSVGRIAIYRSSDGKLSQLPERDR